MIVMVTGHRPNKLKGGYDNFSKDNLYIRKIMRKSLEKLNPSLCISGMALGIDTLFALTVLELKLPLLCAIPCKNHSRKWLKESKIIYDNILKQASEVILVTNTEYNPYLMQVRNEYMVNKSDIVLAFWNGTKGGTANCVKYARNKNKKVYIFNVDTYKWEK